MGNVQHWCLAPNKYSINGLGDDGDADDGGHGGHGDGDGCDDDGGDGGRGVVVMTIIVKFQYSAEICWFPC